MKDERYSYHPKSCTLCMHDPPRCAEFVRITDVQVALHKI